MKKLIIIIVLCITSSIFAAGEKPQAQQHHQDSMSHANHKEEIAEKTLTFTPDISVKTKGMVCAFCVQGIEKKMKVHTQINNVYVDLDQDMVFIKLNPNTNIDNAIIKNSIQNAGFAVESISRK